MSENKRLQLLILIGGAAFLVFTSIAATVLFAKHFKAGTSDSSTKRALGIVESRPKFDQFSGHGLCQTAIYKEMEGKIISLNMDQRSASFNEFERTNTLVFHADVVPPEGFFLSEQHSTVPMTIQCITSTDTNTLVKLIIAPSDE